MVGAQGTAPSLLEIYERLLPGLRSALAARAGELGLSAPHLVDLEFDGYQSASRRLLVVGQETYGWDSGVGNPSPWWNSNDGADSLVRLYDGFELGKSYYASPFWVATRQLAVAVGEAGTPAKVGWTNLFKVDEGTHRPGEEVRAVLNQHFDVLSAELELAKPDAIVFFTGAPLDEQLLSRQGPEARLEEVDGVQKRVLARVRSASIRCPAFRTYHPAYLRRRGKWDVLAAVGLELSGSLARFDSNS